MKHTNKNKVRRFGVAVPLSLVATVAGASSALAHTGFLATHHHDTAAQSLLHSLTSLDHLSMAVVTIGLVGVVGFALLKLLRRNVSVDAANNAFVGKSEGQ